MATTYEDAGQDDYDRLNDAVKKYRHDLEKAGVTFKLLLARNNAGPAVKLHGHPCAATVRIVPLKGRAAGLPDVEIVLDEERWTGMSATEQTALLHHEITHPVLVIGDDGKPKRDDLDRPKLKMRLHDIEIGVFKEVAQAHGPQAIDYQQLESIARAWQQGEFSWG